MHVSVRVHIGHTAVANFYIGPVNVSMGAYDGAEVCELVGTYMLNLLSKKYNKNDFGLYRDDGLAVLKNKSGPQSEQVKKTSRKYLRIMS